jgi:hypothetical protein
MKNLKYVALEVIKSPGTKLADVECGAFMGIVDYKGDDDKVTTFVVLQNTEKSVRMYNITEYGVMTLQAETDEMKYMTVFTRTEADQKASIEMLRNVIKAMTDEKRMLAQSLGTELINADSYKDMPNAVFSGNNLSSSAMDTTVKTTNNTNTGTGTRSGYNYNTTGYNVYKEPEKPTVLNFRRKGKLPAEDKLVKMRNLVMALAEDGATIKVPIPKCDLPEKEDTEQEAHSSGGNSVTV